MKSLPKLIRRFVGILLCSVLLLMVLNLSLFAAVVARQNANRSPWQTAQDAAEGLRAVHGGYVLDSGIAGELASQDVWAIFLENGTLRAVWQTENLPDSIPLTYTASGIASLTRGYLDGYPTFTGEGQDGLMVLGYPKNSFWKHMWPSWDYQLIANLPKLALIVLGVNLALIFLIYLTANVSLLRSVEPLISAVQALPTEHPVYLREAGPLSELAAHLNQTAGLLQQQRQQLQKQDTARANWIAGVSHDIRTPLAMVMGRAGQLEEDPSLSAAQRRRAAVIVSQSQRIRDLINDLNLASKLEYNMQPLHPGPVNLVALVRQAAVDFLNLDLDNKHPIVWETGAGAASCTVLADRDLVKRAVGNLIQNSIRHNAQGCRIFLCVKDLDAACTVEVSDDGRGATDAQIAQFNGASHAMACGGHTAEPHGLGLLIVRQIMAAHGGTASIGRSRYGGFAVTLTFPKDGAAPYT